MWAVAVTNSQAQKIFLVFTWTDSDDSSEDEHDLELNVLIGCNQCWSLVTGEVLNGDGG